MAIDDYGHIMFGSDSIDAVIAWTDQHDYNAQFYSIVSREGPRIEIELELFAAQTLNRMPA
jgi:hypothetical protein